MGASRHYNGLATVAGRRGRWEGGEKRGDAPFIAGKWLADLHTLVRRALARAGVTEVYGNPLCTVSDPHRCYSYRRDKVTGRMAALIWRDPAPGRV